MKALGRGAISRLANVTAVSAGGSGVAGAVYSRDDWNAGRSLAAEERRCGMVARLCDASAASPSSSTAASGTPVEAVVRVQSTDSQVSEVDASGHGAFLEKSPRARWRKISRAKMLLVEDTATPFSSPDKTFAPRVQSYGEYVRRIGKLPDGQPLLRFVMYRDGYSLASVRHRFQYEIGVSPEAVHFATPPGGSFASVAQFGLAIGVTREQLAHAARRYNAHPLILDDRDYHAASEFAQLTATPRGHLHRIVLRCVPGSEASVSAQLQRLTRDGFLNYFGVEKFGVGGSTLFDLAAAAHQGDLNHAVGGYLQTLAESSPLHHAAYLAYVNAEDGTAAGAMEEWRRLCERAKLPRRQRDLFAALQAYHLVLDSGAHGGAAGLGRAWELCGVAAESEESAAAFVWNAMASQRLLSFGARPVRGDLVLRQGRDGVAAVEELRTDAEAAAARMEEVVLPVPSRAAALAYPTHSVNRELFSRFASKHHLAFLFDSPAGSSQVNTCTAYRHVICRPDRLQAVVLRDPTSCAAMKSDYFLLQEHKPTESWSLDYERRVREPSPFNVSERFRERMQVISQHQHGQNTVMLSFALPAATSPWVALREVFDLRYGTFHDLYGL